MGKTWENVCLGVVCVQVTGLCVVVGMLEGERSLCRRCVRMTMCERN